MPNLAGNVVSFHSGHPDLYCPFHPRKHHYCPESAVFFSSFIRDINLLPWPDPICFAKILNISTGMPSVFANPYASIFQHISSQKIAQLRYKCYRIKPINSIYFTDPINLLMDNPSCRSRLQTRPDPIHPRLCLCQNLLCKQRSLSFQSLPQRQQGLNRPRHRRR